jgi:isoleucyl-tRNA synthetase
LLGSKLGKHMKAASEKLSQLTQAEIAAFEKSGLIELELNSERIQIAVAEVEILTEDMPGWLVARQNELTVALDVQLNDELVAEGNARELVNRIQRLRKEKDFNVTDRIVVEIENHPVLAPVLDHHKAYICTEILAGDLQVKPKLDTGDLIEISNTPVKVFITLKT